MPENSTTEDEAGNPALTVRYLYGYGATKHIPSGRLDGDGRRDLGEAALCGAYGGFPRDEPQRPVCKRCAKRAAAQQGSAPSPLSLGEPFRLLSQENQ